MLHIILGVLEILGILFLALILLLLLILLAVVFVPLRYRLQVTQTPDRQHGEVRLTWLLHLVSFSAFYDLKQRKTGASIRICGRLPGKKGRSGGEESAPQTQKTKAQKTKVQKTKVQKTKVQKTEEKPERPGKPGSDSVPGKQGGPETSSVSGQSKKPGSGSTPEQSDVPGDHPPKEEERGTTGERRSLGFKNLFYKVRHFCDTIKKIPGRIRRMAERPRAFYRRLLQTRQMLDDYQAAEVLREVRAELAKLLPHFRIRRGSGYLEIGTGDPAATADLTGLLYLILPACCGQISLNPDFEKTVFQADLELAGHVRICHLLTAFWWGFRNQKLRRILEALGSR